MTNEIADLRGKLDAAQKQLGLFEVQRTKLAERAAEGETPKGSAELHDKIDAARLPVEVLQGKLATRQRELETAQGQLRDIEHEISIEAAQARREARFSELESAGREAAGRIAEHIRALLEDDLPAFDAVGRALTVEFVGLLSASHTPEATRARHLIASLIETWQDGSFLRAEHKLRREGWVDGDLELNIRSLRPPRSKP